MIRLLSSLLFSFFSHASTVSESSLSFLLRTQVFDSSTGQGVPNIKVELYKRDGGSSDNWQYIDTKMTDQKGAIDDLLPYSVEYMQVINGRYKLVYNTEGFYSPSDRAANYAKVAIEFDVSEARHSYIPIALTRYGHFFNSRIVSDK